ncbi:hypothetical protein [Streptomyces vinaceus]|uniref:hypothetical protein n=1 Tax=Streptomyces vinaceus TaxID=1960 RepID=UPI0019B6B529|nr:hypothetical protein [Streptomyces vinaceus]GHE62475.1 hypothetical protein GCM10017778_53810 [Streptomyces vinaceus]
MIFRTATREDLPVVLALPADAGEERAEVGEAHERAFAAIEADARNELLVLCEPGAAGAVVGCLRATSGGRTPTGSTNGWASRAATRGSS